MSGRKHAAAATDCPDDDGVAVERRIRLEVIAGDRRSSPRRAECRLIVAQADQPLIAMTRRHAATLHAGCRRSSSTYPPIPAWRVLEERRAKICQRRMSDWKILMTANTIIRPGSESAQLTCRGAPTATRGERHEALRHLNRARTANGLGARDQHRTTRMSTRSRQSIGGRRSTLVNQSI